MIHHRYKKIAIQHEHYKTPLIVGSIVVGLTALLISEIYYYAAAYNNPTTYAHKCSPNQLTTLPVVDSNHDTIEPITSGKAVSAFPARLANSFQRLGS